MLFPVRCQILKRWSWWRGWGLNCPVVQLSICCPHLFYASFRVVSSYGLVGYTLHSSPKEVHIDLPLFSRWPWVTDPDLGSCHFCQMVLTAICKRLLRPFSKLKLPEVGVCDLGTSGWFSYARHSEKSVFYDFKLTMMIKSHASGMKSNHFYALLLIIHCLHWCMMNTHMVTINSFNKV